MDVPAYREILNPLQYGNRDMLSAWISQLFMQGTLLRSCVLDPSVRSWHQDHLTGRVSGSSLAFQAFRFQSSRQLPWYSYSSFLSSLVAPRFFHRDFVVLSGLCVCVVACYLLLLDTKIPADDVPLIGLRGFLAHPSFHSGSFFLPFFAISYHLTA